MQQERSCGRPQVRLCQLWRLKEKRGDPQGVFWPTEKVSTQPRPSSKINQRQRDGSQPSVGPVVKMFV